MSLLNTKSNTVLSKNNSHPMDSRIQFHEIGHKYTILHDKSKYTSVTTWVHENFPKFDADAIIKTMMEGKKWTPGHKYWGLTPLQIKTSWAENSTSVSEAGTNLHYEIECFMNNGLIGFPYLHANLLEHYPSDPTTAIEWGYFIEFIRDFPHLKPYRTEWTIYDEEIKIAGSVDMIYENADGTLSIYDWKRSKEIKAMNWFNKFALTECIKHICDTNYWHYALQLNIYKTILEKNYGKTVKELFLVKLHPNNDTKSYELISLPILKKEIHDLMVMRKEIITK